MGVTISIFHTTDLHGNILPTSNYDGVADLGGFARCATQIRQWRLENPHSLTVDVGDLYQGTSVGLETRGQVMVKALNALNYDAWVFGNHEFDWGMEPFSAALSNSAMPVLAANATLGGHAAGKYPDSTHPFSKLAPYLLKEVGGFKIAIVGVTTPGMKYWHNPKMMDGLEVADAAQAVSNSVKILRASGVDAIVVAGHMGLRPRGDDFANQVQGVVQQNRDIVAFLAGHTHRDIPNSMVEKVHFTQASYFGIHAGRLDLTFDPSTRQLLSVKPSLKLMDASVSMDPAVISMSGADLENSAALMSTAVGEVVETIHAATGPGRPSEIEKLIAKAITESLAERRVKVDAVFHGLFSNEDIMSGPKTVADCWKIIPYENFVVTGEMDEEILLRVYNETLTSGRPSPRNFVGLEMVLEQDNHQTRAIAVLDAKGRRVPRGQKYIVAMNSFDAQSAGQRMMKLREWIESREARSVLHPVQTREALISYFTRVGKVGPV